jgi:hypothetical protein
MNALAHDYSYSKVKEQNWYFSINEFKVYQFLQAE